MNAVIVIMGPPAAGKTTLARALASAIGLRDRVETVHVEVDALRYMLASPARDPLRWVALLEAVIERARSFGARVVVDGLFWEQAVLQRLRDAYPTEEIVLDAATEVRLARNRTRSPDGPRLPDDEVIRLAASPAWSRARRVVWPDGEPVAAVVERLLG